MNWTEVIITGLALGFAGSLHCVGMCGAIVTALSFSANKQSFGRASLTTFCYNSGRVLTYVLLGAVAGLIGSLGDSLGLLSILRLFAAVLLIMTGLYLTQWWQGLLLLEKAGQKLWQRLKPLTQSLSPSRSLLHALGAGMLWGLIPCGLVYSALGIATAPGEIVKSSVFMLAFGAGTFTPMMMMGVGFTRVAQWLKKRWVRFGLAFALIVFGAWSLYANLAHGDHSSHGAHSSHQHHEAHNARDSDSNSTDQKDHAEHPKSSKQNPSSKQDDDQTHQHHH